MSARALNALAAGRAPACWRRETAREAARPGALRRACAWVAESAPPVRLRAEPLFGSCLSSFASGDGRAADPPQAVPCSPRPAGATPDDPPQRPAPFSCAHGDAKPAPPELPERADRELLCRLAGEETRPADSAKSTRRESEVCHPEPRPRARRAAAPECGASGPRPSPPPEPPRPARDVRPQSRPADLCDATRSASAQSRWRDELSGRTRRVLARAGSPPAAADAREEKPFDGLWAQPVAAGPEAPPGLLSNLVNPPRSTEPAARDERVPAGRRKPVNPADSEPPARRTRPPLTQEGAGLASSERFAAPGVGSANGAPAPRRHSHASAAAGAARAPAQADGPPHGHRRAVTPEGEYLGPLRGVLDTQAADDDAEGLWARGGDPPALAAQLPPLIPAPAGWPAPGVASAAARQGARDEAAADEDLEALAAKIRRILEEDARRHGIDV
ncbi:MAG TPA: hypothetical protein VG148_10420 [Pyrinomonadaceae bacterium]|nr:hypothetical protein [Pyrinomonadaceae bacterium]